MATSGSGSSGSAASERGSRNSSERSSSSEEERLRRLFKSCDADGDGYLDVNDLTYMCGMLQMSDSVTEVRQQLGLHDNDRISFDDFLRCRSQVMDESNHYSLDHPTHTHPSLSIGERWTSVDGDRASGLERWRETEVETDTGIDSDTSGAIANNKITSWPTLSSDSLAALSSTKPDSADYDSGALDLGHEPVTLTELINRQEPKVREKLQMSETIEVMDIAERLHASSLNSMRSEIIELKGHVSRLIAERNLMLDHREQTSRYEERVIELHSVIAELRKKLDRHQINVIKEEEEFEESDQAVSVKSDLDSANDDNNEICQEFSRVVSQIEDAMAVPEDSSFPVGGPHDKSKAQDLEDTQNKTDLQGINQAKHQPAVDTPPELPPRASRACTLPHGHGSELIALQADNEELRRQTGNLEVELGQMSEKISSVESERDALAKQVNELKNHLSVANTSFSPSHSRVNSPSTTPVKSRATPPPSSDIRKTQDTDNFPVAKVAGLKKLRTCAADMPGILGSEVAMMGVESTSTAEHLVQSVQAGSNMAELISSASTKGVQNFCEGVTEKKDLKLP